MKQAEVRARAASTGVTLSAGQAVSLIGFEALVRRKAIPLGVVARGDAGAIWERHIFDSLRAAPLLSEGSSGYDIGSGAGFPGLVLGIARPDLTLVLVEQRARRAAFLELAVEQLGVRAGVRVAAIRAEDAGPPLDFCLARAVAGAAEVWALGQPLLRPGGRLIYFAGGRSPVPGLIPGAASVEQVAPLLETSGPLVIMTKP